MPFTNFPTSIDPVGLGTQPMGPVQFPSMESGPHFYGGALFIVLLSDSNFPPTTINVWKSIDNGATWNVLDAANAPISPGGQSTFDGLQTLSVVLFSAGLLSGMTIKDFDLLTETWQATSGASPNFATPSCSYYVIHSTGTRLVVFSHDGLGAPNRYSAMIFAGGAWGAAFLVDTNAYALLVTPSSPAAAIYLMACTDSTDRTHLFFIEADTGVPIQERMFYQAVSVAGVLGSFFEIPNVGTVVVNNSNVMGIPCIVGANIVWPTFCFVGATTKVSAYIGTPLAAPVWILHQDIDPGFAGVDPAFLFWTPPAATLVSGQLNIISCGNTADLVYRTGIVRLTVTIDFLTWLFSGSTFFNIELDPSPVGFPQPQGVIGPLISSLGQITFTAVDPAVTNFQRYIFLPFFVPFVNVILNANALPAIPLPDPTKGHC